MTRTLTGTAALEDAKSLIRDIFDLCDDLGMTPEYVAALQRNISTVKSSDTAILRKIRESLVDHKRATLVVLRRIEARERVLSCMSQFVEDVVGFRPISESGGGSGGGSVRRAADLAPPVVAEGDAILESLAQCTESVANALSEWEGTSTRLWAQDFVPGSASTTMLMATDAPDVRDVTVRANRFQLNPAASDARRFRWKGEDYAEKMRVDASFLSRVREVWTAASDSTPPSSLVASQANSHAAAGGSTPPISAVSAEEARATLAATRIQAVWKGARARMIVGLYRMKFKAAKDIQKAWRRRKWGGLTNVALCSNDVAVKAATRIQAHWRGYAQRRKFFEALRLHRSAAVIQRWFRFWECHYAMRDRRLCREERKGAALTIERFLVRSIWRKRAAEYHTLRMAVILIQQFVRKMFRRRREREERAARQLRTIVPASTDLVQQEAVVMDKCANEGIAEAVIDDVNQPQVPAPTQRLFFPERSVDVEDFAMLVIAEDSAPNQTVAATCSSSSNGQGASGLTAAEQKLKPTVVQAGQEIVQDRHPIPFPVHCRRAWSERPIAGNASKLYFDNRDVRICGAGWAGESEAAATIQRAFRRYRWKKSRRTVVGNGSGNGASECVANTRGTSLVTKKVVTDKEAAIADDASSSPRTTAVSLIQALMMAKCSAILVDSKRPKPHSAVLLIQAWWRRMMRSLRRRTSRYDHLAEDANCESLLVNIDVNLARRRKASAIRISTFFLRLYRRWRLRDDSSSRIARAFRLFRIQRTYCTRKRERRLLREKRAAEEEEQAFTQAAVRRHQAGLTIYYYLLRFRAQKVLRALDSRRDAFLASPAEQADAREQQAFVIQRFWRASLGRLQLSRARVARTEKIREMREQDRLVYSAVSIQTAFRGYWAKREVEIQREKLRADKAVAALVIQKAVRRWLATNEAWQLRVSQLSMFKELQRLRRAASARSKQGDE